MTRKARRQIIGVGLAHSPSGPDIIYSSDAARPARKREYRDGFVQAGKPVYPEYVDNAHCSPDVL